ADNGQPASVHSGNYGNIVPNPVLPLARLIADIEERVGAYAADHDAFRREATEVFAKWEEKAVWTPFLRPTVNINHFMTDGASPTLRRTIIPRTAHARLDVRLTPRRWARFRRSSSARSPSIRDARRASRSRCGPAASPPATRRRGARSPAGSYVCSR